MTAVAEGAVVAGIDPADAVQILSPNANRFEWLAARRVGLGGSDISALVGMSQYTSAYELWEDKTGRLPLVDEQSEAAEMGTLLEPVIRDRFARMHGVTVRPTGMLRSARFSWMFANPDGLCSDGYGYEGKTCSLWKAHEWGTEQEPLIPDHAELQAQWCMAVTGLQGWWVACLIGGQRNVSRFVRRDDDLIGDLVLISRDFWHDHVLADVEPPIDGSKACTSLLTERYALSDPTADAVEVPAVVRDELVAARESATEAEKTAKAAHEAVKNRVRMLLGSAERLVCDDDTVWTWQHTERFAYAKFRQAYPALWSKYQKAATVLDVDALSTEHSDIYRQFCTRELRFTG